MSPCPQMTQDLYHSEVTGTSGKSSSLSDVHEKFPLIQLCKQEVCSLYCYEVLEHTDCSSQ